MADTTYQPGVYRQQGGARFVVTTNGTLDVESGGELDIESGGTLALAGTAITSTAAELNIMDGVTSTAAELNLNDNQVAGVTYVVGAEGGDVINLGLQLTDAAGADMATVCALPFYMSTDSAGKDVATTGTTTVAVGTDGGIYPSGDDSTIAGLVVSEADGDIDLDFGDTSSITLYFNLILPTGAIATSAAIALST